MNTKLRLNALRLAASLLLASIGGEAAGQGRPVFFDTGDAGEEKAIRRWGFDLTWPSSDNAMRSLEYMGVDEVDYVRVGFRADAPLVGGALTAQTKAQLDEMARIARLAGTDKPWTLMPATESGVDPWYKSGTQIVPSRWVQGLEATVNYYNHPFVSVEPFNEPDFGWGQGTRSNLVDVMKLLETSPVFSGVLLGGPSTLNSDEAASWYAPVKDHVDLGTTHTLAGTMESYINFVQSVVANGATAVNPEAHNVVEVIVGAEYGLEEAMWWGAAELTRSSFVKACQGLRLGYAEDRSRWTAAAVYRAPNGAVQGFVGASERMAQTTSYLFVSKDRDVYYDGHGPQRSYSVTIPGGDPGYWLNQPNAERLINISWGEDVQPVINGRYTVVNRNSRKVMEVAGGSSGDGANIQQGDYQGATHQQWSIVPLDSRHGGDYSYFSMKAFHSGKSADVYDWSLASGGDVRQWLDYGNENQEWFFEYVEDGYFYIRSRWSGKYLEVSDSSTTAGANIGQRSFTGGENQQWRLVPAGVAVEFDAPSAPVGLEAVARAASVALHWEANAESDLSGYSVYRSLDPEGPFELVARGVSGTTFVDEAANEVASYFYKVRAVDESLNRSDYSALVSATLSGGEALVAYLDFEDDMSDGSGNGNDAVSSNVAGFLEGKLGTSSLYFNGATFNARLPATVASFDEVTIAAWVYWSGGSDGQRIFSFGSGSESCLYLTPKASGGGLQFVIKDGEEEQSLDAPGLESNRWVHVAISLDGSVGRLLVDGVLADSGSVTLAPKDVEPVLNFLGRGQLDAEPFFNGRLDDFRIYNYGLQDGEVAALAGVGRPMSPTGLAALWTGDAIELSWRESIGATGYSVGRSTVIGGPYEVVATGLTSGAYVDLDAADRADYFYAIVAVNEVGDSLRSDEIGVSTRTLAEAWRFAHFGTSENAGVAADGEDPDGDFVSNLLERAFGGNPLVAEQDLMPKIDEARPLLSLIYRKALAATDLEFRVQGSGDLALPWGPANGSSEVMSDNGVYQWIRFARPVGDEPALFLRLEVVAP